MQTVKERITDYFNGIVEIEITPKEQRDHNILVKKARESRRSMLYLECKKIKRILNEKSI